MPRSTVKKGGSMLNKATKSPSKALIDDPGIQDAAQTNSAPDFSMYKFEKKPHVKIEFEKESPEKDKEGNKGLWEPANWREFLINLRNMRANNDAPVDTMGCHMAMDENAPPKVMRYQSLIALMLSSQTKDQVTFAAMERLREKGLTVENVLKMSDEELGQLIYPVGFWKTKIKYIKKTTQTLKEQYDGDIPDSVDKLCKLTGVGPKMAHICMQVAWNKTTGIGVDTHVHRISNRIGWVKKPTATPEDTRKALQSWLPFDLWSEVNHLMVGFGQTICQPVSPLCHECLNRDICPSSGMGRKSPNKKSPMKQNISPMKQNLSPIKQNPSPMKKNVSPIKLNVPELGIKDKVKEEMQINDNDDENIPLIESQREKPINKKNGPKDKSIVKEKEENRLNVENNPPATQKRKVTPKKISEENDKQDDPIHEKLSVTKSPNKRKVSPKKPDVIINVPDLTEINLNLGQSKGKKANVKLPNKGKISKKPNLNTGDGTNNSATIIKKSPSKRKAVNDDIVEADNVEDGPAKSVKNTRANKKTSKMPTDVGPDQANIKRKSPRIKNNVES